MMSTLAIIVLILGGRLIHGSCILVVISATKTGGRLICRSTYMRVYTITEDNVIVNGSMYDRKTAANPQLHISMLVVVLVWPRSNSGDRYHSDEELKGSSVSDISLSISRAELKFASFTSPLHSTTTTNRNKLFSMLYTNTKCSLSKMLDKNKILAIPIT